LSQAAEIGVILHGPEIVDSGLAQRVLDFLETRGRVTAVMGGTMGRTAVIDAGLEQRIDISRRLLPSRWLKKFNREKDVIYLLNQGKTRETAVTFGSLVLSRSGRVDRPLVQVDGSGIVIPWNTLARGWAEEIAGEFNLETLKPPQVETAMEKDGLVTRRLHGVRVGENILVDGIVVGKAVSTRVEITARRGRIVGLKGVAVKPHGLEKLGEVDLKTAIIRSGDIRRTGGGARARTLPGARTGNAVIIDHCAEACFELAQKAEIVVTVGDDTTSIAGDILYRMGIPIIGLTDGDLDSVTSHAYIPPSSTIILLQEGTDDIMGRKIKKELFNGNTLVPIADRERFKKEVLAAVQGSVKGMREY